MWAARFFKTRAQAKAAIEGGKVRLNGNRSKPSRAVKPLDALEISRGEVRFEVIVRATGERRQSAELAQQMYEESAESLARREAERERRHLKRQLQGAHDRRPGKRDRRLLRNFKGR